MTDAKTGNVQFLKTGDGYTTRDEFRRDRSATTAEAYRQDYAHADRFLGFPFERSTARDLQAWVRTMVDAGDMPRTIARRVASVSSYLRQLVREGELDRNPADGIRTPKVHQDESPTRGLDREEARALLATCDDSVKGLRDRALLSLLLCQALRVSEAINVHVSDLGDDSGHRVLVVRGKGGKTIAVPLQSAPYAALRAWMDRAGIDSGPILRRVRRGGHVQAEGLTRSGAYRLVQSLAQQAGITKKITPHSLRHTAVTLALEAGVSLRHVQDFARHADPRTTRRYDRRRHSLNNPAGAAVVSALVD